MNPICFILNDSIIKFPISGKLLRKIPESKEDLLNILFNHHKYYVQSKVRKEIFQNYLDYWKDDVFPQVDSSNIMEYYQLSMEFGFLNDYFASQHTKDLLFNLYSLIYANENGKCNKKNIERIISLHLDDYINNLSHDLGKVDINSLFNIFYHEERILKDHDKAYKFIIDTSKTQTNHIFVLLGSLDSEKFKIMENKRDALIKKNDHFGFSPQNAEIYIPKIDQEIQNLKEQNKSLIDKLEITEQENEILKNYQKKSEYLLSKINELKDIESLYFSSNLNIFFF